MSRVPAVGLICVAKQQDRQARKGRMKYIEGIHPIHAEKGGECYGPSPHQVALASRQTSSSTHTKTLCLQHSILASTEHGNPLADTSPHQIALGKAHRLQQATTEISNHKPSRDNQAGDCQYR